MGAKEYSKTDFESLSELRAHPGWQVLIAMFGEMRSAMDTVAAMENERDLWRAKGWLECADQVLALPEEARARLDEYDE